MTQLAHRRHTVAWLLTVGLLLVGCAGNPSAPPSPDGLLHDKTFAAPSASVDAEQVFAVSDAMRTALADRGAWANIKPMPNRVRLPPFSRFLYRYRNLVERFFSKLKHFRAVATRFEKHAANYLALVKLAASRIWMRFMSR